MEFTITTTKQVAEQIQKQCEFDARMNNRSYEFGGVYHEIRYSVVLIKAKNEKIEPSDLFWLGHFSAQINL